MQFQVEHTGHWVKVRKNATPALAAQFGPVHDVRKILGVPYVAASSLRIHPRFLHDHMNQIVDHFIETRGMHLCHIAGAAANAVKLSAALVNWLAQSKQILRVA